MSGWTHIAVIYEDATPRLYINGVLVRTGVQSYMDHIHPGNLVASGLYGTMTGEVDEVRVWKTIRTEAEIVANMNRSVTPQQPDLAAYWPIGNNSDGTVLEDVSSNHYDVTLNGSYGTGSFTNSGAPVTENSGYRYGFNGQEISAEIGEGLTTAQFWEYDSRIGRRWNVDPLFFSSQSPFACFNNNPVSNTDHNGLLANDRTIKKGDTYSSLAKKYGTTPEALKRLNGYDDKLLPIGKTLLVIENEKTRRNNNRR